jgi:hypothetical protein
LLETLKEGDVRLEVAKAAATNPSDFELNMRMFSLC